VTVGKLARKYFDALNNNLTHLSVKHRHRVWKACIKRARQQLPGRGDNWWRAKFADLVEKHRSG